MKTFLDEIAEELLKHGSTDLSSTCIVLPNRRAGVFFRNALSKQSLKAIWAPTVRSIEDFVFELSDAVKIDRTTLLFTFYAVYRKQVNDPQSLDLFANWAPTFLSDANEVDLNLINAADIYSNLHSIERMERWNPQNTEPTDFQKRHLNFVAKLHGFYTSLRENLEKQNLAYQGMAFRKVAENIESIISQSDYSQVWFVGFNALTVSEEYIINGWLQAKRGNMFWDMDSFYADDPIHEAGHYIRKYRNTDAKPGLAAGRIRLKPTYNWKRNSLSEQEKEVHLIAVQRNVAQAHVAASILNSKLKKNPENHFSTTAVVLNNDDLLMPLLHALPTTLQGVNITMGYGLQHSQSATFIDRIFGLYDRFSENENRFYHLDVTAIISNGLYITLDRKSAVGLRNRIIKEKRIYVKTEYLATSAINKVLFNSSMATVAGFIEGLKILIDKVHTLLMEKQELQIEMEFLFLFSKQLQRLSDLVSEFGGMDSIKTLHNFWRQLVRAEQLDFVGEPLRGLQIMGMLETRNLDFEEVIILGVNEGNLPSNSHSASYFTFDVRKAFGLACSNERDAVTAYHFYRLLHRAKKIYLIYDQDTDSFGRGEVSRYVRQLKMESGNNIRFQEWNVEQENPDRSFAPQLNIEKGTEEFAQIMKHGKSGFSPSALNTFRACPLKFYFSYVAGYREQEELKEAIDHAIFGTAVHNTLEKLYTPFVGKPLSENILKDFLKKSKELLRAEFDHELALDGILDGRNLLAYEVGLSYIKRVIDHDVQTIKLGNIITPLQLEEQLKGTIKLMIGGVEETIGVKGLADRIDRLSDGTIRLIDYKTGAFDKTNSINDVEKFQSSKTDHAFQLLLYAFMLGQQHPEMLNIRPTVFYLRSKKVEHQVTVSEDKVPILGVDLLQYAKQRLEDVLHEMFDKEVPFLQTEEAQTCSYCDFSQICQR